MCVLVVVVCVFCVVVVVVCCCSDDSLRCVYVNNTRGTNWQNPVPSHLGVKLPATPAPPALEHSQL